MILLFLSTRNTWAWRRDVFPYKHEEGEMWRHPNTWFVVRWLEISPPEKNELTNVLSMKLDKRRIRWEESTDWFISANFSQTQIRKPQSVWLWYDGEYLCTQRTSPTKWFCCFYLHEITLNDKCYLVSGWNWKFKIEICSNKSESVYYDEQSSSSSTISLRSEDRWGWIARRKIPFPLGRISISTFIDVINECAGDKWTSI